MLFATKSSCSVRWLAGLFALVWLLASCEMLGGSSDQGNAMGGSSDQGNAVQVLLVDRLGAPLPMASLEIRPEGWMHGASLDTTSLGAPLVVADSSGRATVHLRSGRYSFVARFAHLASARTLAVNSDGTVSLVLRATSDVVGQLPPASADTLFVPGTRVFTVVGPDGRFRMDSIPEGADELRTSDGRTLKLDSTGSGYVREYRSVLSLDGSAVPVPDTLIPKYYFTFRSPLALEATRPSTTLESWVPDSVWVSGDTVWIDALMRSCDALADDGISGWRSAESLFVYRKPCPSPLGEPVRRIFHQTPRRGIWTVGSLQPFGYDWELPP